MGLKLNFSPTFFKKRNTMQKKLFGYMFILAAILLCLLASFLFLLGRFDGTAEATFNTLSLQAEVFDRDISMYFDTVIAKSISLSKSTTALTEGYMKKHGLSFNSLDNSVYHIENIESEYMDLLSRELLRADCSGAFIMLNTSRTASNENSKAGVYIQKDVLGSDKKDAMLLYRGTAALGKEKGIMPHRKWNLEFKRDGFPNYDEIFYSDRNALEYSCRLTDIIVLPGMSERVMLVAIPLRSKNGVPLGICGFEVSESLFKASHAQPTMLKHLTCVFSHKAENVVDCNRGMSCGIENGYFLPAKGVLEIKALGNGLKVFENEHGSYVGISADLPLCITNNSYEITVMIPRDDYARNRAVEFLQITWIVLLSAFASVFLCMYFSKRYISPVVIGLNKLKQAEIDMERSNIAEIDELFDYLAEKSRSYRQSIESLNRANEQAQSTIEKIAYDRKKEVAPDDYEFFIKGVKTLTPAERNIFNMYLAGKNIRQIADENNIKEATVKFHNHNIYDKLGVTNKKELLRFAALYLENNGTPNE